MIRKQRSKLLGTSAFYSVFNPNVQPIFLFYMLLDPEPKLIIFLASSKLLNIYFFLPCLLARQGLNLFKTRLSL